MIYDYQEWHGQGEKMIAACKRDMGSTPITVKQLFRSSKATVAFLEFIDTTRVGKPPCIQKEVEEANR